MAKFNIDEDLFKMFFADSLEGLQEYLAAFFMEKGISDFIIWDVTGNICQPSHISGTEIKSSFDIYELGYEEEGASLTSPITVSYFDETFTVFRSIFFGDDRRKVFAITLHSEKAATAAEEIAQHIKYLSKRALELFAKNRRMDLYVDYQKKVDFVKKAGIIFKALEIEAVISVSLSFFSEVFSADAVCALYGQKFYGIGLEESDIDNDIIVEGHSLRQYMEMKQETEFTENEAHSNKFNIKNIFFVYEEICGLRFALFNIITEVVPDKDFSSLVSGIVSIAVENAINHEKITVFKVEETEMNHTIEILNKFVMRKIRVELPGYDIFAMNCPAKKAGGDFVEVKRKDNKIKFCVADVCGKGYSAAVFTVVLSSFFSGHNFYDLKGFITSLNKFLLTKKLEDKFITGFFAVLDTEKRELEYIYCGHEPVALITPSGLELLESLNLPLGLMDEEYETKKTFIPVGSTLFAYTDGLLEYANFEQVLALVKEESISAEKTAEKLYTALVTDPETQKDDFTCVIMKL